MVGSSLELPYLWPLGRPMTSEEDFGHVEGIQVDREVSSAGAGDCVSAAIVHSLLTGASIREAAEAGNAAGAEFCRTDHFGENYF